MPRYASTQSLKRQANDLWQKAYDTYKYTEDKDARRLMEALERAFDQFD